MDTVLKKAQDEVKEWLPTLNLYGGAEETLTGDSDDKEQEEWVEHPHCA